LKKRHTQNELAKLVPLQQFIDADFFLCLRAQLQSIEPSGWIEWRAWSILYRDHTPHYLVKLFRNSKNAQKILTALSVENIDILRARWIERMPLLRKLFPNTFFDPTAGIKIEKIAGN
jgi:hypothetical protein